MSENGSERAKEITEKLYQRYGTSAGTIFGILAEDRDSVYAIVKCVLENIECSDKGVVLK